MKGGIGQARHQSQGSRRESSLEGSQGRGKKRPRSKASVRHDRAFELTSRKFGCRSEKRERTLLRGLSEFQEKETLKQSIEVSKEGDREINQGGEGGDWIKRSVGRTSSELGEDPFL